ncbi:MAG: FAD-linked oxidase [Betaproteobacteria bacterium]|nr:MAG: FAD-linked oxidase [Betaproteobacteria bacterium]
MNPQGRPAGEPPGAARGAEGVRVKAHAERVGRLVDAVDAARRHGTLSIGLAKRTSNLFRDRQARSAPTIDLAGFDQVLRVDADRALVEAEGMATFESLADATLARGHVPAVVPQLKSITLGGAVAGVGIEASSFRHGLVHDTVVELDVLAGDGRVVRCTPDNEHRDLFLGFPNSYGTLGYALRLVARTVPAKRFVHLAHARHADATSFFADLAAACGDAAVDFVDGVVFGRDVLVLTRARFVDRVPSHGTGAGAPSDYTGARIYYRSLLERGEDWLAARDFLWRWDTDWFWCSRNVGAQHPLLRRLYGRRRLNSVTYQRIMRWNARLGFTRLADRLRGLHAEPVIQDVDVPLAAAPALLAFLHERVGILPVWVCPFAVPDATRVATLYPLAADTLWVNFGFWDVVKSREPRPDGFVNRAIEREVAALGGRKSLYSESTYTEDEFWALHDRAAYRALKRRYDPQGALPDLYEKCVLRR